METLKEHSTTVFTYGVGGYLLFAPTVPTVVHWFLGALIAVGAILSLVQYGTLAIGWKLFMANKDLFGPGGESHERALSLFDTSVQATQPYQSRILFAFSLIGSVVLMAGLLNQDWTVLFALEFLGSVIGYAVVRSFLTNYHNIYGLVNGSAS